MSASLPVSCVTTPVKTEGSHQSIEQHETEVMKSLINYLDVIIKDEDQKPAVSEGMLMIHMFR